MKETEFKYIRQKHYVVGVSTSCSALVGIPGPVRVGAVKVGVEVGVGAGVGVETGGHGVDTDVGLRLVAEVGVEAVVAVVVIEVEVVAEACLSGTAMSDLAGVLFAVGAGLLL